MKCRDGNSIIKLEFYFYSEMIMKFSTWQYILVKCIVEYKKKVKKGNE